MTRDDALFIARRIMDRTEQDKALHLDAIADEVMAGVAILKGRSKKKEAHPGRYHGPSISDAMKLAMERYGLIMKT